MYEVYESDDLVLPILKLRSPCEIRVELKDEEIRLLVGQRDMTWNRKTGELVNSGTFLGDPRDS